jgi:hypothetical protein
MVSVLYEFPKSVDPQLLEEFMTTNLLPGLKGAQGLQSLQQSTGELMSAGGPPPYARVVQAHFPTLESLFGYVQSPPGLATQEFLESTGTLIVFYEVQEL